MPGLCVDHLHELAHASLDRLDNVGFELCKRVLHADQVLSVVVFLLDLLVQPMHDAALEHVGILCRRHLATMRLESSRVLAEELDVFLGHGASLVDRLGALAGAFGKLFRLVLDLGMQALEHGEDGALELLCGLIMLVRKTLWMDEQPFGNATQSYVHTYLCVRPDVLEHARNASEGLVEVVPLLKGILYRLHTPRQ
jgi:hypothetical protein